MKKLDLTTIKKIGIFDSGIGGLSILKIFQNHHIQEVVYYADIAFMPYGNKTPEQIQERSVLITDYLILQGVNCIIIACHTASAHATEILQKEFPKIPIIGLIEYVSHHAAQQTINKKIGIMGTVGTIASKRYDVEFKKINPKLEIISQACPDLATLIEQSALISNNTEAMITALKKYLMLLIDYKIDTLILGCTHYSLVKDLIKKLCNYKITIVSAEEIIQNLIPTTSTNKPLFQFYTTGDIQEFATKAATILGWSPTIMPQHKHIEIVQNK